MTRIFLKLGVAVITFTLGVSVTAIYWLDYSPDVSLPDIAKVDARYSCFPGLSLRVVKSQSRYDAFSDHLKAMNELPLAASVDEDESYRFLWVRSFHRPVMVHVSRSGERYFIVVKRLNGKGGYSPGTVDLRSEEHTSELQSPQ